MTDTDAYNTLEPSDIPEVESPEAFDSDEGPDEIPEISELPEAELSEQSYGEEGAERDSCEASAKASGDQQANLDPDRATDNAGARAEEADSQKGSAEGSERGTAHTNKTIQAEGGSEDFRQEFEALDLGEKGSWCEQAVVKEAEESGHTILIEHLDSPTTPGFDCASMDPETGELHIWEAKNFGSRSISEQDLAAWQDVKNGEAREGYRQSWEAIISAVPEGSARDALRESINEGKVTFHLRIGPESEVSPSLQNALEEAQVPGAKYDWAKYTYDDMMRVRPGRELK